MRVSVRSSDGSLFVNLDGSLQQIILEIKNLVFHDSPEWLKISEEQETVLMVREADPIYWSETEREYKWIALDNGSWTWIQECHIAEYLIHA